MTIKKLTMKSLISKKAKLSIGQVASKYNVSNQAVRYIMKSKNMTLEDAANYYEAKAHDNDDNENNELKVSKLEAQISKLKIESSEKFLKIQKAIKNLIDKKEVESFIIRVASAVKSAKSLVFSDLSTKLEGLESGEIDLILQDASNQIDKNISKEFEKMIESLDND